MRIEVNAAEGSEGRSPHAARLAAVVAAIVVVAVAALWVSRFTGRFFGHPDALDFAQMGRELLSEHSLSTSNLYPRHVPYLKANGFLEQGKIPNLFRWPGLPILNACLQWITGDPVLAAVAATGVSFILSAGVFFLLAARFSGVWLGIVATLAFLADASTWVSSYSGMTEPTTVLFILLVVYLVVREKPSATTDLAAGLLCGAAYLTRYQSAFLLPLAIAVPLLTRTDGRRLRAALITFAGFLVVCGPWFVRNSWLTGDPFFSFSQTNALAFGAGPPVIDFSLHAPTDSATLFQEYGPQILRKVYRNIWPAILNPADVAYGGVFGVFLWLAILGPALLPRVRRDPHFEIFRWAVVFVVFANFLVVSLVYPTFRYFDSVHPLLLNFGVQEVFHLIGGLPLVWAGRLRGLLAVVLAVAAGVMIARGDFGRNADRYPDAFLQQRQYRVLRAITPQGSVIASTVNPKVALYAGRLSVGIPVWEPRQLFEIDRDYLPIDYVLFSRNVIESTPSTDDRPEANSTGRPTYGALYKRPFWPIKALMLSEQFLEKFEFASELETGDVLYRKRRPGAPGAVGSPGTATLDR